MMETYQSRNQLLDALQEPKFSIKPTEIQVSNKVPCKQTKPSHQQIDIMFLKDTDQQFL